MYRRRWLPLAGMVLFLAVLAFFLRDVIYQTIVVPLAYLWWVFQFYYSLVPQLVLWILLLVGVLVIALSNFVPVMRPGRRNESNRRLAHGQVETLARLLSRVGKGNYYKWQVANRLGAIASRLSEMSDGPRRLGVRDEAVEKYLDAGVTTSFVDYPHPSNPFQRSAPTILDLDPSEAVDYLESQWEKNRGSHS
ncbi:MAG: hypothetical protein M1282_14960 [Chloroflexi bacterium]|nr:hypothetical protein [Chloroflexota bacterium]